MIYSNPGGVPHILHVDNGKDYTAKTMTGQSRRKRNIEFEFDAETVGFYQSIGIEEVGRSLPYQPWDKPIERFFKTVCDKFSRWFESYTGTPDGLQDLRQAAEGRRRYARARGAAHDGGVLRGVDGVEGNEVPHAGGTGASRTRARSGSRRSEIFENGERYEKAHRPGSMRRCCS